MKTLIITLASLLAVLSCAPSDTFDGPESPDVQTLTQNGVTVSLRYMPADATMSDSYLYFHLSIGFEDQSKDLVYDKMRAGRQAYSAWLQKLMFEMKDFIHLETASGDSIPPDLCRMERSYGLHKSRSFLLMFPSPLQNDRKDQKLTLRLREFGLGTGQISFQIKTSAVRLEFL
ncbi:MAG: hypothetical protein ACREOI_08885 [bacterium]